MAKSKKNFVPDVSVIIPMYNVEKYIGECLESILNQTFQNFEVIIVDDCSKDNSVQVVENFSEKFAGRLNLIELKKNFAMPGLSRNFALEQARGKYIYFLDSDDFIEPDTFEKFFEVAEKFNADVVHSEKFFKFVDGKNILATFQAENFATEPTLESFDMAEKVSRFIEGRPNWTSCDKFYRRKFLTENKITFPATRTFEDFVFYFQCVVLAKNFVRVPFVSYHYRMREDSTSHSAFDGVALMSTFIEIIKVLNKFMDSKKFFKDNPDFKYAVTDYFAQDRIGLFAKNILLEGNYSTGEVYDFFNQEIFSKKSFEAVPSYLFISNCIYKLLSQQQAKEIADLKNQLSKLQSWKE